MAKHLESTVSRSPSKSPLALIALLAGGLALVAAVLHFWIGPIAPQEPIDKSLAKLAVSIRDAVVAEVAGEEYEGRISGGARWDADKVLDVGTIAFGLAAILLAVASFIRREDLRMSGSAVALGGGAIAFQFAALALGVIVCVILVAAILSSLGFS